MQSFHYRMMTGVLACTIPIFSNAAFAQAGGLPDETPTGTATPVPDTKVANPTVVVPDDAKVQKTQTTTLQKETTTTVVPQTTEAPPPTMAEEPPRVQVAEDVGKRDWQGDEFFFLIPISGATYMGTALVTGTSGTE